MKRVLLIGILAGASLALTGCFPTIGCEMGGDTSSDGGTSGTTDGGSSGSFSGKSCIEMGGPLAGTAMDAICKAPSVKKDTGCDKTGAFGTCTSTLPGGVQLTAYYYSDTTPSADTKASAKSACENGKDFQGTWADL